MGEKIYYIYDSLHFTHYYLSGLLTEQRNIILGTSVSSLFV